MSLAAMSVAMYLSGVETEQWNGCAELRWLCGEARSLSSSGNSSPALSISSTTSSSGFNSWNSADTNTKEEERVPVNSSYIVFGNVQQKIIHEGRDILDLGSNLNDKKWNLSYTPLPQEDFGKTYFDNRSQYSRVNGIMPPLHVDVPCSQCTFIESFYD